LFPHQILTRRQRREDALNHSLVILPHRPVRIIVDPTPPIYAEREFDLASVESKPGQIGGPVS
jgi:hypothetical protein